MTTLADISTGNTGAADVAFLVALILALLGVVAYFVKEWVRMAAPLVAGAVAALALGWLIL